MKQAEELSVRPEVTQRIIELLDKQNEKGLKKYGTTIDQVSDIAYDWKLMALEEAIDLIQYQQKEIMRLERLLNPI
jgi:3-dehydroquinate synthase class II